MRYAEREGYHIIDWPRGSGFSILDLCRKFPSLVEGKYLVNTCFDSGILTLSELEKEQGWRVVGRLPHSPQIGSYEEIPHDQFDEWLVFDGPMEIPDFETMVNFCDFSPIDFEWEDKKER